MQRPWPELFAALAVPRLPGSEALAAVERDVAAALEALGFEVELAGFDASPRRLAAASVAGAALGWVSLGLAPLLLLARGGGPAQGAPDLQRCLEGHGLVRVARVVGPDGAVVAHNNTPYLKYSEAKIAQRFRPDRLGNVATGRVDLP